MSLRVGDILATGGEGIVSAAIRVFAPGDAGFAWKDLKNYNNLCYPTHVCNIVEYEGKLMVRDTTWSGLKMEPIEKYTQPRGSRYIIAVIRLPIYTIPAVRRELNVRNEIEAGRSPRRRWRSWYPYGQLLKHYVPGFGRLPVNDALKYCSKRVLHDVRLGRIKHLETTGTYGIESTPREPVSPHEMMLYAISQGRMIPPSEWRS